jgi:ribosomal protein S18 acetylase RimI-like enzyme
MRARSSTARDRAFLEEMLFEAFFWDSTAPRPPFERFRMEPEFAKIFDAWGRRAGDRAVIVEEDDARLGAGWFRLWTPELHSYGFVDSTIPEIGLAVAPEHRSKGVGRLLLASLISVAKADGFAGLSLSVNPANRALALYEAAGFRKLGEVGDSGTSWTLMLSFHS